MKEYRFKRVLKDCTFFFSTLEFENNYKAFRYAHETALNELDVYCVDVYDGDLLLARFFRVVY
jgi:hypothetical protein